MVGFDLMLLLFWSVMGLVITWIRVLDKVALRLVGCDVSDFGWLFGGFGGCWWGGG